MICEHEVVEVLWVDEFRGIATMAMTECVGCGSEVEVDIN